MEATTPAATQPTSEPAAQAPSEGSDAAVQDVEALFKSRKHKVKADGADIEVDYDELLRGYGHMKAANARMQEAAELRKAAEAAQKREKAIMDSIYGWKQDPSAAFSALEQLGIDVDSIAHDRVLKKMAYEMMSEPERRAFDAERELQKYKAREQQEAEARKKGEMETLKEQAATELENSVISFLEANPNLDSDPVLVGRAIDHMIYALEEGQQINFEAAYKKASATFEKERQSIFEKQLQALLGSGQVPKELAEAVRKADVAALRKDPPKRNAQEAPREGKKSVGVDDFFNDLEKRYKK
jgi:hypothetical protein